MYQILFFLAASQDPYPHLPPARDADRFPTAAVCREQVARATDHLAWLAMMAPAWPERREWFVLWTEQAERDRFLWGVLHDAVHARECQWSDETVRSHLTRYRWHVGEARYAADWTPPMLPPDLHRKD